MLYTVIARAEQGKGLGEGELWPRESKADLSPCGQRTERRQTQLYPISCIDPSRGQTMRSYLPFRKVNVRPTKMQLKIMTRATGSYIKLTRIYMQAGRDPRLVE